MYHQQQTHRFLKANSAFLAERGIISIVGTVRSLIYSR